MHIGLQICVIGISLPAWVNNTNTNVTELRVGFITSDPLYGAVSLALEQAQRDGLLEGYNIRFVQYLN